MVLGAAAAAAGAMGAKVSISKPPSHLNARGGGGDVATHPGDVVEGIDDVGPLSSPSSKPPPLDLSMALGPMSAAPPPALLVGLYKSNPVDP
jgi:hypothetical protein